MIELSTLTFSDLMPFIAVGFAAQLVDGALGMAFGVITNSLLVGVLGVPPSRASANVHIVETFTTAASGISHVLHRNVDWPLFWKLLGPGVIGGVAGAYLLSNIDGDVLKPFIMSYLTLIGVYLLIKGFLFKRETRKPRVVAPLGLVGGFLDAIGGGGWGPIVTSNLMIQGVEPRRVIGTVNSVEFFLTLTVSITFLINLGASVIVTSMVGLLIGGVLAAPLGAVLAKRISAQKLLLLVGTVLTLTSGYAVWNSFFG